MDGCWRAAYPTPHTVMVATEASGTTAMAASQIHKSCVAPVGEDHNCVFTHWSLTFFCLHTSGSYRDAAAHAASLSFKFVYFCVNHLVLNKANFFCTQTWWEKETVKLVSSCEMN